MHGVSDVVVIPGGRFGPAAGMLMYAGAAAGRRGAAVHRHTWSQDPSGELTAEAEPWVREQLSDRLDSVGPGALIIAKSFGTHAAALAAERSLPAIWLTPLLTAPRVVNALRRGTAPRLLVGGTADAWWDAAVARELSPHVLEVPDADHGMYVPGPLLLSIAVLEQIIVAVDDFLDAIDWPSRRTTPTRDPTRFEMRIR